MRRQNGYISAVMLIIIVIGVIGLIGWAMNIVKLIQCDFDAPYKAEVIRTVGLIPPVGAITGYLTINDNPNKEKGTNE